MILLNSGEKAGIHIIWDLYIEGTVASFTQIQNKYKLPGSNFFRYLQIRQYVRKHLQDFETFRDSSLDGCLQLSPYTEKLISFIHDTTMTKYQSSWHHFNKREIEMDIEISDGRWEESLEHIHWCSHNARHCLIQFKILHCLYSKDKLYRIYPEISPTCDRCLSADDTLLHSFALCPKVKPYWINIFKLISKILIIIIGISDL